MAQRFDICADLVDLSNVSAIHSTALRDVYGPVRGLEIC